MSNLLVNMDLREKSRKAGYLHVRHLHSMGIRQETQEIAAVFYRHNRTNNNSEMAKHDLAKLVRADEYLGWRDKGSNFQLALKNRIIELKKMTETNNTENVTRNAPQWIIVTSAIFSGLTFF